MGQVQRRRFLVAGSALLAAQLARAQVRSPDRRIIGYLNPGVDPKLTLQQDPALQRFMSLGWTDDNFVILRRHAENKPERLQELTQELIRARAEVIITNGPAATLAVARATSTIPIVFFNVPFPVELGLVDSFARPGRNVTGASAYAHGLGTKRFEFLRDLAPSAKRVYLIKGLEFNETLAGKPIKFSTTSSERGRRLGFEIKESLIRESKDIEPALAEAVAWGAQALFIDPGTVTTAARHRIAEFAIQHRPPSAVIGQPFVEAGGLFSYAMSVEEFWAHVTRCMEYVDRILRGAHPRDLAVVQPSNYELIINAKTAKALGLTIPQSLLLRAARVIE